MKDISDDQAKILEMVVAAACRPRPRAPTRPSFLYRSAAERLRKNPGPVTRDSAEKLARGIAAAEPMAAELVGLESLTDAAFAFLNGVAEDLRRAESAVAQ